MLCVVSDKNVQLINIYFTQFTGWASDSCSEKGRDSGRHSRKFCNADHCHLATVQVGVPPTCPQRTHLLHFDCCWCFRAAGDQQRAGHLREEGGRPLARRPPQQVLPGRGVCDPGRVEAGTPCQRRTRIVMQGPPSRERVPSWMACNHNLCATRSFFMTRGGGECRSGRVPWGFAFFEWVPSDGLSGS